MKRGWFTSIFSDYWIRGQKWSLRVRIATAFVRPRASAPPQQAAAPQHKHHSTDSITSKQTQVRQTPTFNTSSTAILKAIHTIIHQASIRKNTRCGHLLCLFSYFPSPSRLCTRVGSFRLRLLHHVLQPVPRKNSCPPPTRSSTPPIPTTSGQ